MAYEIRQFGDPVLKSRAAPVRGFDDSLRRLTNGMLATLRAGEGRAAIAANQVGVLKRVFVAEMDGRVYVVVNPVVEVRAPETETDVEGCLSVPGVGVEVERHLEVVVSGKDVHGGPVRYEAGGEVARMMQHEIDHLDGTLMFDRAKPEARKAAMKQWREQLLERAGKRPG